MRVLCLLLAAAALASAQQPRILNAKLETREGAAGFASQFRSLVQGQTEPMWIGYAQPAIQRGDSSWQRCSLESRGAASGPLAAPGGPVLLEGSSHISVLFRVAGKTVEKIRTFSLDCELDAGGLPLVWFNSVPPAESLSLLASMDNESAVTAIALHAGDAAGALLEKFAAQGEEKRRRNAIFWLVSTRVGNPRVLNQVIQIARSDASANIRGHALFWLAQKAGDKAAGTITAAIRDDPDTKVKERAVFALSQLPKDQGIPLLIEQARANKNPVVRKRAIFWLGQSKDPRALAFIEEILTR
jgi:hypothetical protein